MTKYQTSLITCLLFFIISLFLTGCNAIPSIFGINGHSENEVKNDAECSDKIHTVFLTVDEKEFETLLDNCEELDYEIDCRFVGVFKTDTVRMKAELKIHGQSTRYLPKKSFTIDFKKKKLTSDQLFTRFPVHDSRSNSFSKIILNGSANDFSRIRNFLAMYLTNAIGGLAPRVDFTRLYINNKLIGLYQIIEPVQEDFVKDLLGTENFDLHKSINTNGNLSTKNTNSEGSDSDIPDKDTDSEYKSPCEGFEVKKGDTVALTDFVCWLESDSCSVRDLEQRIPESSLYSYVAASYFTGETDGFWKNFYIAFNKDDEKIHMIRWDADATFGRNYYGKTVHYIDEFPFDTIAKRNGLFDKAHTDSIWLDVFRTKLNSSYYTSMSPQFLYGVIDELENTLREEMKLDLSLWRDVMIVYYKNNGIDNWEYTKSDMLSIWENDLKQIRSFLANRQSEVLRELQ